MPEGVTWTRPEGGLFLFLTLPEGYDAEELFQIAIEKNVAFYLEPCSLLTVEVKTLWNQLLLHERGKNIEGVKRLADAIKELYARKK